MAGIKQKVDVSNVAVLLKKAFVSRRIQEETQIHKMELNIYKTANF